MACDPQTLISNAQCWLACGSNALNDAFEIALLCAIRDGDTSLACNPQALIAQAECLLSCLPAGSFGAVRLGILCEIAQNGTGGGGETQVFAGDYSGVAPPFSPIASAATAYDTVTEGEWHWYSGAWH